MDYSEIIINHEYGGLNPVQFGYADCISGHSFGPAVRTHWLLHYIVKGTGAFYRQGRDYQLKPGEVFVIPPYLETYYEADRVNPWEYIWIGFTTGDDLPAQLAEPVISCPGMGSIFEDMRYCGHMNNGRSAFLSGKLWELMGLLLEQGKIAQDYVEKAVNLMRSEYMNPITVQGISDRLGLDRSYFSTLFRKKIGMPPQYYLTTLRLEKAALLMTVHGESPSTAATSVGYPDIYNFSKMFKRHFGLSPRHYINDKLHAGKPEE